MGADVDTVPRSQLAEVAAAHLGDGSVLNHDRPPAFRRASRRKAPAPKYTIWSSLPAIMRFLGKWITMF